MVGKHKKMIKREYFDPEELAIGLSHYDLGIIKSIREFPRGSSRAPKCIVECERGRYLFKRRQHGVENLDKVAFTHHIQLSLAAQNFPLPHLQPTRDDGNSMLIFNDHIYELQEFIAGTGYDQSLKATEQSGHALGLYHKLLEHFRSEYEPPTASYHNAKAIHHSILHCASAMKSKCDQASNTIDNTVTILDEYYRKCVEKLNKIGLHHWPSQIVHGDWHPGNMLFRDQLVAAVIDYDTARLHQRVIDFANGALQFSIIGGGDNPLEWPANLDMPRFKAFLHGYDSVNVITQDELKSIPLLMCEAIISEAVLPIASTGGFGRFNGCEFLQMIRKKVEWILKNYSALVNILNTPIPEYAGLPPQNASSQTARKPIEDIDDPLSGLAEIVERINPK